MLASVPLFSYAAGPSITCSTALQTGNLTSVTKIMEFCICFISTYMIPLIVGLGIVYYVWNAVTLIKNADSEKGRQAGQQALLWGIVALVAIVSVWALVKIVTTSFFGSGSSTFFLPQ